MSLECNLVTELNYASNLIQRLAEIVQDAGGEPDDTLYELIHLDKKKSQTLGVAIVDEYVQPIFPEPLIMDITNEPLGELCKRVNVRFIGEYPDLDALFREWDSETHTGTNRYQAFQPTFDMSAYNVSKFCKARGLNLLSVREVLHIVPQIDMSDNKEFNKRRPSAKIEGIPIPKISGRPHTLDVWPVEDDGEIVIQIDKGSHSVREDCIFLARLP